MLPLFEEIAMLLARYVNNHQMRVKLPAIKEQEVHQKLAWSCTS
jgi:hypothetical protein